ncbi:L-fuculose-phosphate aldolase [Vibrio mimicus]
MNRFELSQQIIDTCLEMTRLGLNQGTAGNISVRFESGMLITPTGVPYEELSPDHIVYVAHAGCFEEGKLPSSEWRFHLACYKQRDDIDAVIHNHAINCAAVSILNKPIPAIHYMIAATGASEIPCVPYATFGSSQLSKYVEEGISKSKAILLQHHGLIVGEVNLKKALWLAHEVEVLAKLYLKTLAITPEVPVLDDASMQIVHEKFKSYGLRVEQ